MRRCQFTECPRPAARRDHLCPRHRAQLHRIVNDFVFSATETEKAAARRAGVIA